MERNRRNTLKRARKVIERQGAVRAPSVDAVEPDVRTDTSQPVAPGSGAARLDETLKGGADVGFYVVGWGCVVPGAEWKKFNDWLNKRERSIVPAAQKALSGVVYKGTVVGVFGP